MHHGSCLCRTIRFEVHGDFKGFFLCHCSRCRKATGSAHAANLFSRDAKVEWHSGREWVQTFRLPETRFVKSFCRNCGAALPTAQDNGFVLVPAGSLDSDVPIRPTAHICMSSRANWDHDLESIPMMDHLPGGS